MCYDHYINTFVVCCNCTEIVEICAGKRDSCHVVVIFCLFVVVVVVWGGGGIVVIFAGLHLLASHYIGTIFASLPNFTSQFQPDLHGEWAMGGGGGGGVPHNM